MITNMQNEKCFACDRPVGKHPHCVDTRDGQWPVFVGANCYKLIKAAGEAGYQSPLGGPKLYDCDQKEAWAAVERTMGLQREY